MLPQRLVPNVFGDALFECCLICMYVCMYAYVYCPGDQPRANRQSYVHVSPVKTLLLREKQFLMNPPHAFASQLSKKSDTEQAY